MPDTLILILKASQTKAKPGWANSMASTTEQVSCSAATVVPEGVKVLLSVCLPACSLLQIDVAIVGAGLAGLATAVALHRVRPDAKIKVSASMPRQQSLYVVTSYKPVDGAHSLSACQQPA